MPVCQTCNGRRFRTSAALEQHIDNSPKHPKMKAVGCPLCNRRFPHRDALHQHTTAKHPKRRTSAALGQSSWFSSLMSTSSGSGSASHLNTVPSSISDTAPNSLLRAPSRTSEPNDHDPVCRGVSDRGLSDSCDPEMQKCPSPTFKLRDDAPGYGSASDCGSASGSDALDPDDPSLRDDNTISTESDISSSSADTGSDHNEAIDHEAPLPLSMNTAASPALHSYTFSAKDMTCTAAWITAIEELDVSRKDIQQSHDEGSTYSGASDSVAGSPLLQGTPSQTLDFLGPSGSPALTATRSMDMSILENESQISGSVQHSLVRCTSEEPPAFMSRAEVVTLHLAEVDFESGPQGDRGSLSPSAESIRSFKALERESRLASPSSQNLSSCAVSPEHSTSYEIQSAPHSIDNPWENVDPGTESQILSGSDQSLLRSFGGQNEDLPALIWMHRELENPGMHETSPDFKSEHLLQEQGTEKQGELPSSDGQHLTRPRTDAELKTEPQGVDVESAHRDDGASLRGSRMSGSASKKTVSFRIPAEMDGEEDLLRLRTPELKESSTIHSGRIFEMGKFPLGAECNLDNVEENSSHGNESSTSSERSFLRNGGCSPSSGRPGPPSPPSYSSQLSPNSPLLPRLPVVIPLVSPQCSRTSSNQAVGSPGASVIEDASAPEPGRFPTTMRSMAPNYPLIKLERPEFTEDHQGAYSPTDIRPPSRASSIWLRPPRRPLFLTRPETQQEEYGQIQSSGRPSSALSVRSSTPSRSLSLASKVPPSKYFPRRTQVPSAGEPPASFRAMASRARAPSPVNSLTLESAESSSERRNERSLTSRNWRAGSIGTAWRRDDFSLHCRRCRIETCDDPTATMCGHLFCHACITEAIISTPRCPVCGTPTLLYCLFRLHLRD